MVSPRRYRVLVATVAVLAASCYDFHLTGPEDPAPQVSPRTVSVRIEYRQPNGCVNASTPCDPPVIFFGSWMRSGQEFALSADPGSHVWRGVAVGVPVNYPPRGDAPYEVRVFDPHLYESPTEGFTAQRLRFGGEALLRIESEGARNEHALVYVDENGLGRNAF